MQGSKIGIITSKKRKEEFVTALKGYQLEFVISQNPDFAGTLSTWQDSSCSAAVVDETVIGSKQRLVAEIGGICFKGLDMPVYVIVSPKMRETASDPRVLSGAPGCEVIDPNEVDDPVAALRGKILRKVPLKENDQTGSRARTAGESRDDTEKKAVPARRASRTPANVSDGKGDGRKRAVQTSVTRSGQEGNNDKTASAPRVASRTPVAQQHRNRRNVSAEKARDLTKPKMADTTTRLPPVEQRAKRVSIDDSFMSSIEDDKTDKVSDGIDDMFDEPAEERTRETTQIIAEGGVAQETMRPITIRPSVSRSRQDQKVIAVCGTLPRSGCSNLSTAIARNIALAGHKVVVCVSDTMMHSFSVHYRHAVRGQSGFLLNKVHYCAARSADLPDLADYEFVILDLGFIRFEAKEKDYHNDVMNFLRADIQLVQVPLGTVNEIHAANGFIKTQDPRNLDRYRVCTFSATEEVVSRFRGQLHMIAPNAFVWNEPYMPWPISCMEISDEITQVIAPIMDAEKENLPVEKEKRVPLFAGLLGRRQ